VEATALRSPELDASTGSGLVRIAFAAPPRYVHLENGGGDVRLTVPPGPYRMELDARSGQTTLNGIASNPEADRRIVIRVASGDITVSAGAPPR
jgi:hypothetical protein